MADADRLARSAALTFRRPFDDLLATLVFLNRAHRARAAAAIRARPAALILRCPRLGDPGSDLLPPNSSLSLACRPSIRSLSVSARFRS
ncbi:MAG: hypothetical protein KGS61_13875 [Verrucomicrobia bacterium]|nr:hypothetical protein [Verrucomicrobiota bacterium]